MSNEPVITIIGRPNVGKSTLFNRLVGQRRAITDPTPGVTRDILPEVWLLGNHRVILIDSGGVKLEQEGLDDKVSQKSLSVIKDADVILFMLECTEITPEDEHLMKTLRPYTDKVVLCVNKVDSPKREDLVWNFFSHGFQRVVGISAAHGLGIDLLEETLLGMLDLEELDEPEEEVESLKIAVMGKPNTGKSTLTNFLTKKDLSIVSDIPGTTRDVVQGEFSFKNRLFTILDTAGIRRKSKVEEDVEYYSVNRSIKTIEKADVVLLMIDSTEGLADQDKKIASLIVRKGKGVILVLNKIDVLKGIKNEIQAIEDRMRFLFPILSFAPCVPISAISGENVDELLSTVLRVESQLQKRVDTATLNTALKAWGEAYQPPRGSQGHFKVYYGTQISTAPIRFLFFINRKKDFPQVYTHYLTNCIRRDLGFDKIPIEIDYRERRRSQSNYSLGQNSKVKTDDKKENVKKKESLKPKQKNTGGRAIAKAPRKKPGAKAKAIAKQNHKRFSK